MSIHSRTEINNSFPNWQKELRRGSSSDRSLPQENENFKTYFEVQRLNDKIYTLSNKKIGKFSFFERISRSISLYYYCSKITGRLFHLKKRGILEKIDEPLRNKKTIKTICEYSPNFRLHQWVDNLSEKEINRRKERHQPYLERQIKRQEEKDQRYLEKQIKRQEAIVKRRQERRILW